MMFYLLCAALCLSVLFLVTAGASMLTIVAVRGARSWLRLANPRTAANVLFAVQISPILFACVIAFAFALPAFLKLEPRATVEGMSMKLASLALAGALVVVTLAARAARSLWATAQVERQWLRRSQAVPIEGFHSPMYRVDGTFPFLAVIGLLRPKVFVGRAIADLLSPAELRAALAHEMAHVKSFDNLKQMALKSTRLPGFLDNLLADPSSWVHASEAAADEDAVAGGASALDLSSALVKMARVSRQPIAGGEVLASQFLPYATASSLPVRIARLERWLEEGPPAKDGKTPAIRVATWIFLLAGSLAYAASITTLLPWIHEALEMLVR